MLTRVLMAWIAVIVLSAWTNNHVDSLVNDSANLLLVCARQLDVIRYMV